MSLYDRLRARVDDQDCQEAADRIDELETEIAALDEWVNSLKAKIAKLRVIPDCQPNDL